MCVTFFSDALVPFALLIVWMHHRIDFPLGKCVETFRTKANGIFTPTPFPPLQFSLACDFFDLYYSTRTVTRVACASSGCRLYLLWICICVCVCAVDSLSTIRTISFELFLFIYCTIVSGEHCILSAFGVRYTCKNPKSKTLSVLTEPNSRTQTGILISSFLRATAVGWIICAQSQQRHTPA